ncbi:MAG: hypothetical protein ACOYD7_09005 [Raoultibacter sp.]
MPYVGVGGGIYNDIGGTVSCEVSNAERTITFDGNDAAVAGGAMANLGTFTIRDCFIINGEATMGGGGAVNLGELTLEKGARITENKAIGALGVGGGILNWEDDSLGTSTRGKLIMKDGSIDHNSARLDGGGVDNRGVFEMTGGLIGANTATDGGGGVHMSGLNASLTLDGGNIVGNACSGNPNPNLDSHGGGIDVSSGFLTMNSGVIHDNKSAIGGGVSIYNGGLSGFEFYGGGISSNTAEYGGGVAFYRVDKPDAKSTFSMYDGGIIDNVATVEGGGVWCGNEGVFTLSGGTIERNTASSHGGALYSWHDPLNLIQPQC